MNKQVYSLTYLQYRLQEIYNLGRKHADEDIMLTESKYVFALLITHLNISREKELLGESPLIHQSNKNKKKNSNSSSESEEINQFLIIEFLSHLFSIILKYSLLTKSHHIQILNQFLQDYIDTLGEAASLKIVIQNKIVDEIQQFYSQIKENIQKEVKTMQRPPELQRQLIRTCNTLLRLISFDKVIGNFQIQPNQLEKTNYLKIRGQILLLQTHILSFFHRSGVKESQTLIVERKKKEEKVKAGRLSTGQMKELLDSYTQCGQWNTDEKLIGQLYTVHDIMNNQIQVRREDVEMLKKLGTTVLEITRKVDSLIKEKVITDLALLQQPINEYPVQELHSPFHISSLIKNPLFWASLLFQIIIYSRTNQQQITSSKTDLSTTFCSKDLKQPKESLSSIIKHILKGIYSISIQSFINNIYPKLLYNENQQSNIGKEFSARKALMLIQSILSNQRKWENFKEMAIDKICLLDDKYYAEEGKNKEKELVEISEKQESKSMYDEATQQTSHLSTFNASSMMASLTFTPKTQVDNQDLMKQILKKTGVKTSKLFKFLNNPQIKESHLPKTIKNSLQLNDPGKSLPRYEQEIEQFSNFYQQKSDQDIAQFWGTQKRYNINEWRFLRELYKSSMISVINLKKKPKKSSRMGEETEDQKRKFWYISYFDEDSQSFSQSSVSKRLKKETNYQL